MLMNVARCATTVNGRLRTACRCGKSRHRLFDGSASLCENAIMRLFVSVLCATAVATAAFADDGVTATEVTLGEPAAFSGPSAGLGTEMWRGAAAAFLESAAAGGVHGRKVRL